MGHFPAIHSPSLRIAHMRAGPSETLGRRNSRAKIAAVSLFASFLVVISGAAITPTQATPIDGVTISSSFSRAGVITPGVPATVVIRVANNSTADLPPASVSVTAINEPVSTLAELDAWLGSTAGARGNEIGTARLAAILQGGVAQATVNLDVNASGWSSSWGPQALLITVDAGQGVIAREHGAVIYEGGAAPGSARLAVVVPVVVPASTDPLLSAETLASLVAPTGELGRLAQATQGITATLAIDPRIPVSVLANGTESAAAALWWDNWVSQHADSFLLAYGDADLAGQVEAGATALLNPGFRDASAAVEAALTRVFRVDTAAVVATPSPSTPAPLTQDLPTWRPAEGSLAWPAANSISAEVMPVLAASGYTSTLLSSANVGDGLGELASVRIANTAGLVSNDAISAALVHASATTTDDEWGAAMNGALVRLATYALDPESQHATIATLSRSGTGTARLAQTLSAIGAIPWISQQDLSTLASIPARDAQLVSRSESADRLADISRLLKKNADVAEFATIAETPELITHASTRRVMSTLSVGAIDNTEWPRAVNATLGQLATTLGSVRVATDSDINMIGSSATLPLSIENGLDIPVTVVVNATPRNNKLLITSPIVVKVESRAQAVARFSAEARVSNGSVLVDTLLTTASGHPIGTARVITINVHADWETAGLISLAIVFMGLVVAGIVRTRGRKKTKSLS